MLAAFYLGWFVQATLVQIPFDYTLTPQVFLGLARLRGMECRSRYAEAFDCTKAVVRFAPAAG